MPMKSCRNSNENCRAFLPSARLDCLPASNHKSQSARITIKNKQRDSPYHNNTLWRCAARLFSRIYSLPLLFTHPSDPFIEPPTTLFPFHKWWRWWWWSVPNRDVVHEETFASTQLNRRTVCISKRPSESTANTAQTDTDTDCTATSQLFSRSHNYCNNSRVGQCTFSPFEPAALARFSSYAAARETMQNSSVPHYAIRVRRVHWLNVLCKYPESRPVTL